MASSVNNYKTGYADGFHDVAISPALFLDADYIMGYEDGTGDRESGAEPTGVKSAYIAEYFEQNNDPPAGYSWTGEFRTPERGEVYFTKNGNAGVAKSDPKNGRKRHMLAPNDSCAGGYGSYGRNKGCQFAKGHKGRCSQWLLK